MADFDIKLLSRDDGSWDAFEADWRSQCQEVDEDYADYAPDVLKLLSDIVSGSEPSVGGANTTHVGALWDAESKKYYAACMLNRAMLPGTPGYTLRVRQLVVSPLLDYGVAQVEMYPDVVIGVMSGIVHLSSSVLRANNIHLHLRSPEDMAFFAAFGTALGETKVFASVQRRGAWLYVEKIAAASNAGLEEEKVMHTMDPRVAAAISHAVHAAIAKVGIDGLRSMSMFPSATKQLVELPLAA